MSAAARSDRLVELIEPVAAKAGFDLEDVTVRSAGKRRLLRVVVDRDAGVTLDDASELSQALSGVLETSGVMGEHPYTLEVTSPGIDRLLTEERHWRRAVGKLVHVWLRDGGQLTGRVLSADEAGVSLETNGARRTFGHDDLDGGQVQVEFRQRHPARGRARSEEGERWTST